MVKIGTVLAWLLLAFGLFGIAYVFYVSAVAGDQDFKGPLGKFNWINRNFWYSFASVYAGATIGLLAIIAKNTARS